MLGLLVPLIWIPLETLFLKLFKTTPGKALFGLKVHSNKYFKRSLKVWAQVVGCGLPPFCFICPFISLVQRRRKELSFDQDIVTSKVSWRGSILGILLISGLLISPAVWDHCHRKNSPIAHHLDPAAYKNWTGFDAPDSSFTAYFPSKVETVESQLPVPDDIKFLELTEHTATDGEENTFSLAYTQLPKKWLKYSDKLIIKHSMLHMVEQMENTDLVTRNFKMHGSVPCIDYTLKSNGKDVQGRMLLVGARLYKLELQSNAQDARLDAAQERADLFFNAFQLSH